MSSAESHEKKYKIATLVMALLALVFAILYVTKQSTLVEKTEIISSLEMEQLQLKSDLQEMLIQYDTLTVSNDQLNAELLAQQEQIKELLKQVDKHKDDAYIIAKLKKEAKSLREIMKGYVATIDSLNTLNQDLKKDNQYLVQELSQAKAKTQQLESTAKNLESIVATGSVLQAQSMTAVAVRVRSNGKQVEVNRADKAEIIRTCAQLMPNRITPAGKKTIYLRIISPDGVVLDPPNDEDGKFEFNGVSGKYSIKRVIDYQNEATDVCVFYNISSALPTGKYIVEMYESGLILSQTEFDLK